MTDIQWHRYLIPPDQTIDLSDWDPASTAAWKSDKDDAEQRLQQLNTELEALQELLFAQAKHKVLIVLQGMDTSGKDGVIRRVFEGVNPQGVRVASFKVPTAPELAHDYLWRIHQQVPGRGEIVIFNRSHYEVWWCASITLSRPSNGGNATLTSTALSRCSPKRARLSSSSSRTLTLRNSASACWPAWTNLPSVGSLTPVI